MHRGEERWFQASSDYNCRKEYGAATCVEAQQDLFTLQNSATMKPDTDRTTRIRFPEAQDAAPIWRLVQSGGGLDLNSSYFYSLACRHFRESCAVAMTDDGHLAGFVVGHRPTNNPDTLFVWQVAVAPTERGRGLAQSMIQWLRGQAVPALRWIEATVTPSNRSSRALFEGIARRLDCPIHEQVWASAEEFPVPHEPEILLRIGPIASQGYSNENN